MSVLIPVGFVRIVCSELRHAKAEVYWNMNRRLLFIRVTQGKTEFLLGPFDNGGALEAIYHALSDVKEMKGSYSGC